jgi:Helicase associated domain
MTDSLGCWVSKQRQSYKLGKLTPDKVDALRDIDFSFNPIEDGWNQKLLLLAQRKEPCPKSIGPFSEDDWQNLDCCKTSQSRSGQRGKLRTMHQETTDKSEFVRIPTVRPCKIKGDRRISDADLLEDAFCPNETIGAESTQVCDKLLSDIWPLSSASEYSNSASAFFNDLTCNPEFCTFTSSCNIPDATESPDLADNLGVVLERPEKHYPSEEERFYSIQSAATFSPDCSLLGDPSPAFLETPLLVVD